MTRPLAFVGGGIASVSAIEALRAGGHDGPITLFCAERHLPYDRPPLSKDVLLGSSPDPSPLRPEAFYQQHNVDVRLDTAVTRIDPSDRTVTDANGRTHGVDAVVLATGGAPRPLPIPGSDLEGVCLLRSVDQALDLRERLVPGARIVVIGGGFIGTEVAAAAAQRGLDVVLLEALALPLQNVLPELAPYVVENHRSRGVQMRTAVRVEAFVGHTHLEGVRLAGGELVPADVAVVGVGMVPRDELAAEAGLAVGDGVHVDTVGRTSSPGVFAIGDVACVEDGSAGRRRLEHWQSAVHSGQRVAAALLGQHVAASPVPWFWSDQYDMNIQLAGLPRHSDERVWRGSAAAGRASILFHRAGQLTGIATLNNGRDVKPVSSLIAAGLSVDMELLADPDADLRKVARRLLDERVVSARATA